MRAPPAVDHTQATPVTPSVDQAIGGSAAKEFSTTEFDHVRDEHVRYCEGMTSRPSRRERPAKPALSREWAVAETIEIMRREGLEKATMRRVAKALDTGPASLYVYVANTADLHSAVLDELIGTLKPVAHGDWRTRLETLLTGYSEVLYAYPGLARSTLMLRPTGPHALRLYDQILGILLEGAIPPSRAAWGVDLLLQYVTSSAAEHSPPAPKDIGGDEHAANDENALAAAITSADPQVTPHLAALAEEVISGTPSERTTWALRALIAGITATPTSDGSGDHT